MNRRGGYPLGVGLDRRRVLAAGLAAVGTGASFSTPLPCQAAPAALR